MLALDEPTSSLSDEDAARLFNIVDVPQAGVAIIYVSHRLREVLQGGRSGGDPARRQAGRRAQGCRTTESDLVRLMVGRELGRRFGHESHALPRLY